MPLSCVKKTGNYIIEEVAFDDARAVRLLDLGFIVGTKLCVKAIAYGGAVSLQIRGSSLCLSGIAAESIRVRPA